MMQYLHQPRAHKDSKGTTIGQGSFLGLKQMKHSILHMPAEQATFLFSEI